ncbi:uncharacterized protein LOC125960231 isoform X8 [Anopheles darlingi]|uniref:uncharacterized protein LOC125960231 isoform X6 n=1 Tax=Anopheles darlingi TaxID=43151 RepID=UPI0021004232|nr:uncharacterized protein LOC125960231 isoform X6 [Anopheles darlingi]XP_049549491.1 uncharacterized protein LOC125960231 isoform X8 [Anopheles darlingi]
MFLVVETVNDNGEKEWKVAPKRWVCTTKNTRRTVLLWPHEISSERQKQLARSGSSKPTKNWSRKECIVQQECSTYDAANAALKELLRPRPKPCVAIPMLSAVSMVQSGQTVKQENEDPLNIDYPDETPAETTSNTLSMMASIKLIVQSLISKHDMIEKQNARIEKQNAHIVAQNTNIIERNKHIEKTNAVLLTKIDLMQKTMNNFDSQQCSNVMDLKGTSFKFEPMETIDQLKRLEEKLNDSAYRRELLSWLTLNVRGNNAHKRMSSCLDLLLSRELAVKCTWTGMFRAGVEKVAMRDQRNIVNLFKAIGTSPHERIDERYIHMFFSKKLKMAKGRLLRHQESSVTVAGSNLIDNNEQRAGSNAIKKNYADSSNAKESLDDELQMPFEVEVVH